MVGRICTLYVLEGINEFLCNKQLVMRLPVFHYSILTFHIPFYLLN